jgi:hypothetical protein
VRKLVIGAVLVACASPQRREHGEPVAETCGSESACIGTGMDLLLTMFHARAYDDPAIAAYVQRVGMRIVRANGDRRRWTFRVIDDHAIAAFPLPPATVYVHRGTLAVLRDEAELAFVLAHQVGHLSAGHLDHLGDDPIGTVHAKGELQADEIAIHLLVGGNYDPRAAVTALRALAAATDGTWSERIGKAERVAGHFAARGDRGAGAYQATLATLVVGPDPRDMRLVDTTVVFGRLGFAIDLPARLGDHRFVKHDETDGFLGFEYGEGRGVALKPIEPALAARLHAEDSKGSATAVHRGTGGAVWILVSGDDATTRAAHMRTVLAAFRPLRAGERLEPRRIDFRAPRALWQSDPP